MKRVKRLIAGLLTLVVLSVLFAGSCVGPGIMYMQSPRWFLQKVDHGDPGFFLVAFRSKDDEVPQKIKIMRYELDDKSEKYSDLQFHLPNGRLIGSGPGKASATITATAEEQGGQLVQVFVIGDTPWTSLSEYRVAYNKIYPLRHADSVAWILLGAIFCPIAVIALVRPIRRRIDRFMKIEPA
jgi:hypothetical protein